MVLDFTNLDALLSPTCGTAGVTTGVCDVSATTLFPAFDIYTFGAGLIGDAFVNDTGLQTQLTCLEADVVTLTTAINSIISLLDEGLPVSLTINETLVISGTTTPSGMDHVVTEPCAV